MAISEQALRPTPHEVGYTPTPETPIEGIVWCPTLGNLSQIPLRIFAYAALP